jgi:hypothetical protein
MPKIRKSPQPPFSPTSRLAVPDLAAESITESIRQKKLGAPQLLSPQRIVDSCA